MQADTITATAALPWAAPQRDHDPDAELTALWRSYLDGWRLILADDDDDTPDLLDLLDELVARIAATPARTMAGVLVRLRAHLCDQDTATELPRSYALDLPADEDAMEFDDDVRLAQVRGDGG